MQDKLQIIFDMQRSLNDEIKKKRGLNNITKEEWMQKQTLAMLSEMAELIDEVNFKWWKNPKPVDEEKVKYELVDIMHFFVSMCLIYNMDAEELFKKYINKNKENYDRQYGRSSKDGYDINKKQKR